MKIKIKISISRTSGFVYTQVKNIPAPLESKDSLEIALYKYSTIKCLEVINLIPSLESQLTTSKTNLCLPLTPYMHFCVTPPLLQLTEYFVSVQMLQGMPIFTGIAQSFKILYFSDQQYISYIPSILLVSHIKAKQQSICFVCFFQSLGHSLLTCLISCSII